MKMLLKTFIVFIIMFSFTTVVNAATEEELINYISEPFTIAGKEVSVQSGYIKEAKRYISTYGVTSRRG